MARTGFYADGTTYTAMVDPTLLAAQVAAAASATAAAGSAATASAAAASVGTSVAAAAASATAAASSASSASTSASTATTQASAASTSATAAAASATTATTQATNAATSASAASTSATAAAASATTASTQATNAATSATAAANSAAQLSGVASVTSFAIGTGSKAFTVASHNFAVGEYVLIPSSASPAANNMWGQITATTSTVVTVNVIVVAGSGTHTDWTIYLSGARGAAGSGTGDMLSTNNLSDVANAATARTNLSLGNVDNTSDATKNAAAVTLTNKTLTSPVVNTPTGIVKGDVGLGNVDNTSDATKNAASVTLTNKTLTAPAINGGTHDSATSLGVRSTGAAFDLKIASSEVLTAGRTLSLVMGDAARTVTLGGNPTLNGGTHSGTNTGDQTLSDATISTTDITTNNVSSSKHGFAPKSPADATKYLNGAATPVFQAVNDSDLALTDITTNNVSITKHGFAPKAPNDATKYLDGTGAFSVPAGGGATAASQANMEAQSSNTVMVTPLSIKWDPGNCKTWARWTNTSTILASSNVSSITDTGTGDWTVNYTTAFSSANYGAGVACHAANADGTFHALFALTDAPAAGSCRVFASAGNDGATALSGSKADPTNGTSFFAFGDF